MITLIVPTRNRHAFIKRLLMYYYRAGFDGQILIGDASDPEESALAQEYVREYEQRLNVKYFFMPGQGIAQTVHTLNSMVQTPYATLLPDDDLLVVDGLKRCVAFLERNDDYMAANGLGALFILDRNGPWGEIADIGDYNLGTIEWDNGQDRLRALLQAYFVVLFSVHRIAEWKKMWSSCIGIKDTAMSAELLPNCLSVMMGKVKQIPYLYMLRQGHGQRYILPDTYDWITNPQWQAAYSSFKQVIMADLMERQGLNEHQSEDLIKSTFWIYLNNSLRASFKYFRMTRRRRMTEWIKIPILKTMLLSIKRFILDRRRSLHLSHLLDRRSRFYAYFEPIYRLIREQK